MKKILFTVVAVLSLLKTGTAQVDLNFETWAVISSSAGSMEDPQGWASFNILNTPFVGMPLTVTKEMTGAIPSGLIAAKITTNVIPSSIMVPNPFRPGYNFDTVGFLGIGTVITSLPPSLKLGATITSGVSRPAALSFSSKYAPIGGDSAFVVVYLSHWNGTSRDTIAAGQYTTNATATAFAVNSITLTYNPSFSTVWADSMFVIASSSVYSHAGAKIGSTLWIDDLKWSGYNSVNELDAVGTVSVFPNPATNHITFKSSAAANMVAIMDVTGRVVNTYNMVNDQTTVQTSLYAAGIYFYNVTNKQHQIINRGKFEVSK
jgi:Secretion system C-terminal sorting domain